jgi:nicotinamide riboside transporter PnuC
MAFLSVTLRDVANRRVNLIIGGILTIVNILHFIEHLAQPSAHTILLVGSTVAVTALVVRYAWKWPRQEA